MAFNANGQIVGSSIDHACLYSGGYVQNLGFLSGDQMSLANGINNNGQVVACGTLYIDHAFLFSGGSMQDLGTLGGDDNSNALAINDSEQVVGYSYINPYTYYSPHAFLYNNGSMTEILEHLVEISVQPTA